MSIDLLAILRDVMVLGYMFILRIGVPILITLMIGAWLRKLLEEKEPVSEEKPVEASQTPQAKKVRP